MLQGGTLREEEGLDVAWCRSTLRFNGSRTKASENGFVISPTFAGAKHPLPPRNAPSNMVKNSSRAASACEKT